MAESNQYVTELKNLLAQSVQLEQQFLLENYALRLKYRTQQQKLWEKRSKILAGTLDFEQNGTPQDGSQHGGLPNFWLQVLENSDLEYMIEDHDVAVLRHLTDVKCRLSEEMGFAIDFYFSPNEFFENSILTFGFKEECEMDPDNPHSISVQVCQCYGTEIKWKEGKNVTLVTKTFRSTKTGKYTKEVRRVESFFDLFDAPALEDEPSAEQKEDYENTLETYYEIGKHILDDLIPSAVLYYTDEVDWTSDGKSDDDSCCSSTDTTDENVNFGGLNIAI